MIWTYCEQWNNLTESPMGPFTPEQARGRHESGQLYTAVAFLDGKSSPVLRVEMRLETGYASVIFMDECGRDSLDYTFGLVDGALFLEAATSYDYGDSPERGGYADAERVESYEFTRDGVIRRTVEADGDEFRESRRGVDVAGNWEAVPQFGLYDSLTRRDRG
ncbi:hypothetical protein [Streptomyces naganishii]|uniref:Uncharacterized protein n=1 Tax=Streptomyces naganishii JCM 4654 TaxID=1306179 RepID=A0A918YA49_9ACTN|nr:hypothetical protein [Streptomyces naganishii]GHD96586.1 hypothetical protein GCM10010508_65920 [Streptomyces naganishii JCM 4654]